MTMVLEIRNILNVNGDSRNVCTLVVSPALGGFLSFNTYSLNTSLCKQVVYFQIHCSQLYNYELITSKYQSTTGDAYDQVRIKS